MITHVFSFSLKHLSSSFCMSTNGKFQVPNKHGPLLLLCTLKAPKPLYSKFSISSDAVVIVEIIQTLLVNKFLLQEGRMACCGFTMVIPDFRLVPFTRR